MSVGGSKGKTVSLLAEEMCAGMEEDAVQLIATADQSEVHAAGPGGWTPLNIAVTKGWLKAAQALLDKGADASLCDDMFCPPLVHVIEVHARKLIKDDVCMDMIKLLIKHNACIDVYNESNVESPLLRAASVRNEEIFSLLVDHGANVDAVDDQQSTPLIKATVRGDMGAVVVLLKLGADVNAQNIAGRTPLHVATLFRNKTILKALLAAGARTDIRDNSGTTAQDIAAIDGEKGLVELIQEEEIALTQAAQRGTLKPRRILRPHLLKEPKI